MRRFRLSLTGTAIVVLLGGLGGMVSAQVGEETAIVPVYVTGVSLSEDSSDVTYERWFEGDVEHRLVADVSESWAWSDPRLPSEWTVTLDQQFHAVPDLGQLIVWTFTSSEADGPGGRWDVNARGMLHPGATAASVVTLEGRGGYEGLYAILDCGTVGVPEDGSDPPNCEGYILQGQPPQLPAPAPSE